MKEKTVYINEVAHKYYYLPISNTLKQILSDPIAMDYIMKFHRG